MFELSNLFSTNARLATRHDADSSGQTANPSSNIRHLYSKLLAPCRYGRWWQTIYRMQVFCYFYKTPPQTPLLNCKENIDKNIICYQIVDTFIGLKKILGLSLVKTRFWCSCAATLIPLPVSCFIKAYILGSIESRVFFNDM